MRCLRGTHHRARLSPLCREEPITRLAREIESEVSGTLRGFTLLRSVPMRGVM